MKSIQLLCVLMVCTTHIFAQRTDSVKVKELEEINILEQRYKNTIERLPLTQGTYLFGGKKSEVINLLGADANIAEKTPRQIFAKVPGVFVYDMDGTGNQTNISTRGLDPHRGWEFNIRADGILTNSDMYAYPASHFSLPMEAIQTIQLVRGTGSLQYGAQFGGMLNYIAKQPDTTKAFNFETINSIGSFGLVSTYNGISGKIGKLQYYGYYSRRHSDGYRTNSESDYSGEALGLIYQVSSKIKLKADFKHSKYLYQIPGPLTDSMFYANPRMSTRARNYFNPTIYVPSFTADFRLSARTRASFIASAVLGDRNSVTFDKPANIVDAIDPTTLQYANRQVDIDHFNSYTVEARLLHNYELGKVSSILVTGVQLMNNDLNRQQLGKGTTGSDFDISKTGDWVRDMHLKTKNFAIFAENRFAITSKFSVTPGIRVELGESDLSGKIAYYDANQLPTTITHKFPLLGLNANYQLSQSQNIYAGFAQAYRPVVFKDIIPSATYEKIDKNLKDAYGYNAEIGYKGNTEHWKWDISAFQIQYNNRMGMTYGTETDGDFYYLRTNIGNSHINGLEIFVQYDTRFSPKSTFSVFTSTAYMDARYEDASIRAGDKNVSVKGNKVESTPDWISRNGITFRYTKLSVTALYSYTANSYADALNTVKPSATGAVGLVPSYGLLDINATYRLTQSMMVKLNINNLTNEQYFTKRPAFYPGPAVWSSDGRSVNVSFAFKI
ncbi:TonB-dependent receptor domain-containing protein [Emticicia sp. BO119]|uniref:TonB-dependent receptor family protein n=1 Tax=Emticicia sp. BO119 TaxID=2757768 RepID=UPI0015F01861|nr:TonB-dependent receptor [Emticicia sp. BO119]MBA4853156.1 TonB-dependent receptor [Emticicia sp. BO119]